jgi:hypothetical protein
VSYADDARSWWAKSLQEQDKARRVSDWMLRKATRDIGRMIRSKRIQSVHEEDEIRKEHERLLEGEAGKYRRSHLTAAGVYAQYSAACAALALLDEKGL